MRANKLLDSPFAGNVLAVFYMSRFRKLLTYGARCVARSCRASNYLMSENISIKAFHGISDFSSLCPAWLRLLGHREDYDYFHHPGWHHALQNWILKDKISYVLIESDDEPIAIVPVMLERHPSLMPGRFDIRSPQHDHIVLSDWIVSPRADTQLLATLVPNIVKALGVVSWGKFSMEGAPEESVAVQLHKRLHEPVKGELPGFLSTLSCNKYSAWFACDDGDQPVHSKMRRNLRRLKSQAEELGPVEMELVSEPTELPLAFDKFLTVEACGWKGEGGSAIGLDDVLTGFYRDMLGTKFPGLTAKINLLWIGDKVVAAQYLLETLSCTSVVKIGYNEEYGKFSPGSMLLLELLDSSVANSETKRVSLVTCPSWANRWHPNKQAILTCIIYNNTTTGIALRGLDGLKAIARSTYRELTER